MSAVASPTLRLPRAVVRLAWIAGMTVAAMGISGCQREEEKLKRHAEEAEAAFLAGDYNLSEIACKHLLRANPNDTRALARLGRIWLERGSPLQAAHYLSQATKDSAAGIDARIDLAKARLALGDRAGARSELIAILDQEPGRGDALLQLAIASASDAEAAETEKSITKTGDSAAPGAAVASAVLALRKGDSSAAEDLLRQALQKSPDSREVHSWQARLRLLAKDPAGAETSLAEAARLAPARSQEKIDHASFLLEQGKRDAAISLLQAAVAATPDFLSAWRLLAHDALKQKDPEEATRFLDQVFAKDALDYDAVLLQSHVWLEEGGEKPLAKAIILLERLRERHPASPLIEVQIARIHLQAGQVELAASAVDRALGHAPDHRDAVLLKADLDLREGEAAAAARSIEKWIEKHPDDRDAGRRLAEAYRALGRPEDALRVAGSLAAGPAATAGDHLHFGQLLTEQKQPEKARAEFLAAESLDPADLRASMELVRFDLRDGRLPAALRRAEEMTVRQPESAPARHLVALVLGGLERWADAEREALESLRLDPKLTASRELLVKIYHANQRPEDALRELERIRKDDPANLQAPMALAMIKESAGDRAAARLIYEEVLERNPKLVPALNNLAGILADGSDEEIVRAQALAEQARWLAPDERAVADTLGWILYRQDSFKRAQAMLAEVTADPAAHPSSKYHHAMACRAMGDAAAAEKWLRDALAATTPFRESTQAREALDALTRVIPEGEAGIPMLKERIAAAPSDMVARLRLAELFEKLERQKEAAATYGEAFAANPDLQTAASRLARLFDGPLNDPDQAATFAMKARELDPADHTATLILAGPAFRAGEHPRAAGLYRECLPLLEQRPDRRIDAALAFFSVAKLDEARSVLEPLARTASEGDEASRLLALLSPDCPESEASAVLAENPAHGPALAASAAAAERTGRQEVAVTRYTELLRLFPDFAPARDALKRLRPPAEESR
jgi:Tfp pilus assembly protein PilF